MEPPAAALDSTPDPAIVQPPGSSPPVPPREQQQQEQLRIGESGQFGEGPEDRGESLARFPRGIPRHVPAPSPGAEPPQHRHPRINLPPPRSPGFPFPKYFYKLPSWPFPPRPKLACLPPPLSRGAAREEPLRCEGSGAGRALRSRRGTCATPGTRPMELLLFYYLPGCLTRDGKLPASKP